MSMCCFLPLHIIAFEIRETEFVATAAGLEFVMKKYRSGGSAMTVATVEQRMVLQKAQQVKKSRHGPRSRSSEYHGVTFYRRIG
ncbi:hypothetical protein Ahy_Scaffold7g108328 isoform A [Arachis hypogaea]|uniref:Uncharacterized protein n=1 Tax=Arachis hypogaea TaxID=3818 RepID=A0A444WNM6_ARAHY|nr:hypothetical protein Ahy_Scaffold7g108328 isoform A [Arachis hypogaea]